MKPNLITYFISLFYPVVNEMLLILIKALQICPFCVNRLKFFGSIRRYSQQKTASVSLKVLLFVEDPVVVAWFLALPMEAFTINSFLGGSLNSDNKLKTVLYLRNSCLHAS